jgi:hypothetical protein
MPRTLSSTLSRSEESILRRVALGIATPEFLPAPELGRLKHLALVEEQAGMICLTGLGRQHVDPLHHLSD